MADRAEKTQADNKDSARRISGAFEESTSVCARTRQLAKDLIDKYGRPRGADMLGDRYAFRDMSAESYRGIRVYAQRCRKGRYEIRYADDAAMLQAAAGQQPLPESMVGL